MLTFLRLNVLKNRIWIGAAGVGNQVTVQGKED